MSEQERIIWETRDKLNRPVTFDTVARQHILDGHYLEFDGDPDTLVRNTVENGNPIYTSDQFTNREVYFRLGGMPKYPGLYLSVIVEHNDNSGKVITAFPQKEIKRGIDPGGLVYVDFSS